MDGLPDLLDPVSNAWLGLFAKLGAALVAGLILGFDREWRGHSAGLRTHMMVALGSAAVAAIALELYDDLVDRYPSTSADPMRIVEGVVAAIGFLGGGVIIQARGQIRGLTTAANLWVCGMIGLAFGAGLWRTAGLTLALAFFVLVVVRVFERRVLGSEDEEG